MTQTTEFDGVLFLPGQEPEDIKRRIETLFAKLDGAYPDKIIIGLHKEHKKWGETVTQLYRILGYSSGNEFLKAYGYTVNPAGGQRTVNPKAIIDELKQRYADGPVCKTLLELKDANLDIAPKFKSLSNQSNELFGMSFVKYLLQEGILVKETNSSKEAFDDLKEKCTSAFAGSLKELKEAYPEVNWNAVKRYATVNNPTTTLKEFLIEQGIIVDGEESDEIELSNLIKELKERYPENNKFEGNFEKLKLDNPDLPMKKLQALVSKTQNVSVMEYLLQQNIIKSLSHENIAPNSCFVVEDNKLTKFRFKKKCTNIVIPEEVTVIGKEVFFNRTQITDVTIPNGVERIQYGAFRNCKSMTTVNIPNTVTVIESDAFKNCKNLTSITIPNSITCIESGAFKGCESITEIVIPDNVERIKYSAFSGCKKLKSIKIPSKVNKIDFGVFTGCDELSSIIVDDNNPIYDSRNNCNAIIETKTNSLVAGCKSTIIPEDVVAVLHDAFYRCNGLKSIIVPDGVESIGRDAFYACDNLESITLPDSVTDIGYSAFGWCNKLKNITIPKGYLMKKHTADDVNAFQDLFTVNAWKEAATGEVYSTLLFYQKLKDIINFVNDIAKTEADKIAKGMNSIIKNNRTKRFLNKAVDFYFEHKKLIEQDTVDELYSLAVLAKATNVVELLSPYVATHNSTEISSSSNKELPNEHIKGNANPIIELCNKNYVPYAMEKYLSKFSINSSAFKNVKFKDSDEIAPEFVVECAIVPYMKQLREKPKRIGNYKKDYVAFDIDPVADKIADSLDKETFQVVLDRLLGSGLPSAIEVVVPYGRYASGKQITALISRFKDWASWGDYAVTGRVAIIIARGAMLLNDTKGAMLFAENNKCLDRYAEIRGTKADLIRDTMLVDFGFNSDGKIIYDLGNTVVEATIGDDLKLSLYDTTNGKVVKSLPKKSADAEKYTKCSNELSDLKKNLKKIITSRNKLLFEYFLSGYCFDADSWKKGYTENPILNKVARLIVWEQDDKTFTIADKGLIDSTGNIYKFKSNTKVRVAHPYEMKPDDLLLWQKYFVQNNLKQPFEQVWEPKYNLSSIMKDRYKGIMIPYYRFINQEKHGIFVTDEDFHNDINIRLSFCKSEIHRIDWDRHSISANDRFEIVSIIPKEMRMASHIIYYFDKCTINERIAKDDVSILGNLNTFTVAQIEAFLKIAIENSATKVTALLMDYKNEHFSEFRGMDEFSLDI